MFRDLYSLRIVTKHRGAYRKHIGKYAAWNLSNRIKQYMESKGWPEERSGMETKFPSKLPLPFGRNGPKDHISRYFAVEVGGIYSANDVYLEVHGSRVSLQVNSEEPFWPANLAEAIKWVDETVTVPRLAYIN